MEYEERIKKLELTTLENRRKRADLIQIYKGLRRSEGIEGDNRSHNSQIIREKFVNTPMMDDFLLDRNATTWNMFPSETAEADTVNQYITGTELKLTWD